MSQSTVHTIQETAEWYAAQAALANQPVLLGLLREARAALAAEFCGTTDSLAGRIDGVIHQVAP